MPPKARRKASRMLDDDSDSDTAEEVVWESDPDFEGQRIRVVKSVQKKRKKAPKIEQTSSRQSVGPSTSARKKIRRTTKKVTASSVHSVPAKNNNLAHQSSSDDDDHESEYIPPTQPVSRAAPSMSLSAILHTDSASADDSDSDWKEGTASNEEDICEESDTNDGDKGPQSASNVPCPKDDNADSDPKAAARKVEIRRTNTYDRRLAILAARVGIVNNKSVVKLNGGETWAEVEEVVTEHGRQEWVNWFVRTSLSSAAHNQLANPKFLIGESALALFKYAKRTYYCTHGNFQKARGTGKRKHTHIRYTGCKARVAFELERDGIDANGKPKFKIVIAYQITEHNHLTSQETWELVGQRRRVSDEALLGHDFLKHLDSAYEMDVEIKQAAAYASFRTGVSLSPQQIRNIIASRFGGTKAEEKLLKLLGDYAAIEGNRCCVVHDQKKMITSMVLQSSAQAELFSRWPETVAMDWTYNTNNLGFKLGALVITGPTGRGIPVCEFLSLTETKVVLTTILEFFKKKNPAWRKIESFIIDKAFTERIVLEGLFESAMFHVAQAVRRALRKLLLAPAVCLVVETLFKNLVYCRTESKFRELWSQFEEYTEGLGPDVRAYFVNNWLDCYLAWSNVGRAKWFSCGNTTTNRVESHWNQVKANIGRKTRIDKVVSAILQNEAAICRAVSTELTLSQSSSRTLTGVPELLHTVANSVSDFVLAKLLKQWDYYTAHKNSWTAERMRPKKTRLKTVGKDKNGRDKIEVRIIKQEVFSVRSPRAVAIVNTSTWRCDCFFFKTHRILCQHIFAAAVVGLQEKKLPARAVARRWRMHSACTVTPALNVSIKELLRLRYTSSGVSPSVGVGASTPKKSPSVRYVTVKGRYAKHVVNGQECGERVVLDTLEKRNVVKAEFEEISRVLERSSSHAFYERIAQVSKMCKELIAEWKRDIVSDPTVPDSPPDESENEDEDDTSRDVPLGASQVGRDVAGDDDDDSRVSVSARDVLHGVISSIQALGIDETVSPQPPPSRECAHEQQHKQQQGQQQVETEPQQQQVANEPQHEQQPVATQQKQHGYTRYEHEPQHEQQQATASHPASIDDAMDCLFDFPMSQFPEDFLEYVDEHVSDGDNVTHGVARDKATGFDEVDELKERDKATGFDEVDELEERVQRAHGPELLPEPDHAPSKDSGIQSSNIEFQFLDAAPRGNFRKESFKKKKPSRVKITGPFTTRATSITDISVPPIPEAKKKLKNGRIQRDIVVDDWGITAEEFIIWLKHTPELSRAAAASPRFPEVHQRALTPDVTRVELSPSEGKLHYFIPANATDAANKQVRYVRAKDSADICVYGTSDEETRSMYVAIFPRNTTRFTEDYLNTMHQYHHNIRPTIKKWSEGLAFIQTWTNPKSMKASTVFDGVFTDHRKGAFTLSTSMLVTAVEGKWKQTSLSSWLITQGPRETTPVRVQFSDIVCHVANHDWLSGTLMFFILTHALRHRSDVFVVDPQSKSYTAPPAFSARLLKYIVRPIFLAGSKHWTMTVCELDWEKNIMTVHFYEPYNFPGLRSQMIDEWTTATKPYITDWIRQSSVGEQDGGGPMLEMYQKMLKDPMQTKDDSWSCGFLSVLMAVCLIDNITLDKRSMDYCPSIADSRGSHPVYAVAVPQLDLQALRLRMIHLTLFCTQKNDQDAALGGKMIAISTKVKAQVTIPTDD